MNLDGQMLAAFQLRLALVLLRLQVRAAQGLPVLGPVEGQVLGVALLVVGLVIFLLFIGTPALYGLSRLGLSLWPACCTVGDADGHQAPTAWAWMINHSIPPVCSRPPATPVSPMPAHKKGPSSSAQSFMLSIYHLIVCHSMP